MAQENSIQWLGEQLIPHAESIARQILGKVRRHGRELQCEGRDSPLGCKIAVVISGSKQGLVMIYDGASSKGTGLMGLIYQTEGGRDWKETARWASRYLGLGDGPVDPAHKARMEREAAERRRIREAQERGQIARRIDDVQQIWRRTEHIRGTLAEQYLVGRGLSRAHLESGELRFHPALEHSEGGRWPALVARVVDAEGKHTAIWRIYLDPKTGGKAPVSTPKMGLGPAGGCAVRLGDDGRADEIAVCEGIETGLAIREMGMWQMPVWCGLSATGMAGIVVPDRIMFVRIYPDGDKPRSFRRIAGKDVPLPTGEVIRPTGIVAAESLAQALRHVGRDSVIEEEPPVGQDYLDILNEMKASEE